MSFAAFLRDILCSVNIISNAGVDDITNYSLSLLVSKDEYLESKTRYQETKCVLMVYFQIIFGYD